MDFNFNDKCWDLINDMHAKLDKEILGDDFDNVINNQKAFFQNYIRTGGRNHSRTWKAGLLAPVAFYVKLPKKNLNLACRIQVTNFLTSLENATIFNI